jgi:hypothetical protein
MVTVRSTPPPHDSKKFLAFVNKVNYDILNKKPTPVYFNFKSEYEAFCPSNLSYTYLMELPVTQDPVDNTLEKPFPNSLESHCEKNPYSSECRVFDI